MQQEGRRRVGADADVWAQSQARPVAADGVLVLRRPQVAGVEENSEVRSAAQEHASTKKKRTRGALCMVSTEEVIFAKHGRRSFWQKKGTIRANCGIVLGSC